jgi:hypothetical protein
MSQFRSVNKGSIYTVFGCDVRTDIDIFMDVTNAFENALNAQGHRQDRLSSDGDYMFSSYKLEVEKNLVISGSTLYCRVESTRNWFAIGSELELQNLIVSRSYDNFAEYFFTDSLLDTGLDEQDNWRFFNSKFAAMYFHVVGQDKYGLFSTLLSSKLS